jgi:hypothetical protein
MVEKNINSHQPFDTCVDNFSLRKYIVRIFFFMYGSIYCTVPSTYDMVRTGTGTGTGSEQSLLE